MIIESIPTTLRSAISAGIGVFLAYVGIKNAGLLKFSIDPGTYTVAGEGADKAQAAITANAAAVPGLVDFNTPAVLVAIAGLAITIFFVVKGIKGGIILSILTTTVLAIAVGLVNLSGIDFASNNLSAAVNDLGTLFGAALGSEGLGSLISNTSRLPETLMAILAFSLTDIFDTIGTLIGTGEKLGSSHQVVRTMNQLNWIRLYILTWWRHQLVPLQVLQTLQLILSQQQGSVLVDVLD